MVSAEWAGVITRWVELGLGIVMQCFMWVVLYLMVTRVTETLKKGAGPLPSTKVLLRRIWCRHRHVARTRGRYGQSMTACVRCSKDVNAGKPREEWR